MAPPRPIELKERSRQIDGGGETWVGDSPFSAKWSYGSAMSTSLSQQSALRWIILVSCAATLYVCWPLWPALVLAAWTAGLARPLLARFERGLKGRRRAAAALSLMLFLLLVTPLVLVTLGAVGGAQDLLRTLQEAASAKSALESIATTPAEPWSVPHSFAGILELLQRFGAQGFGVLSKLAGVAATGLVALLIYFAGAYSFLVEGTAIGAWIDRHSPIEPEQLRRLSAAFHETGRGLLVGVGLTVLTQGLMATVIYLALGVPRAWVLGPVTGLGAIVPVIGSGLVWGPIALSFALTGHPVKAALLAALGLGVIASVDNVLQPFFARLGALKMPTFLLFVAVFGGLAAFGPWGALLGPLVLRLTMEALALRPDAETAPTQETRIP